MPHYCTCQSFGNYLILTCDIFHQINDKFVCRAFLCDTSTLVVRRRWGHAPPPASQNGCFVSHGAAGQSPAPFCDTSHGFVSQVGGGVLAVSHSRHVSCVPPQTCLLCDTEDMSAVSRSRHVCGFRQQTCRLCHTASRSRHACCVTHQTCTLHIIEGPPKPSKVRACRQQGTR